MTKPEAVRYRDLLTQHRAHHLSWNRAFAHLAALLEEGDADSALQYVNDHLDRVAAWSVEQLLDEIATDPPVMYDGVGVNPFA